MGRSASAAKTIPDAAQQALQMFGENLRIARERRGEPLRAWAQRLDVSVPTLQRMESGDPTVGIGVYATAVWLCGLHRDLGALAGPATDHGAQEIEVARASRRRR
jgi:hypothetical protein